jgi:hypothetical protein
MWDTLNDNLPQWLTPGALVAVLTILFRFAKPRRFISFLAAVKERETLLAMVEHEKTSGLYWEKQAKQCQADRTAHSSIPAASTGASAAGGGSTSSNGADGRSQKRRSTGSNSEKPL